jgi:hypothetical protein
MINNGNKKNINNDPSEKDHNSLVISRISPDKKIENAIEIGESKGKRKY